MHLLWNYVVAMEKHNVTEFSKIIVYPHLRCSHGLSIGDRSVLINGSSGLITISVRDEIFLFAKNRAGFIDETINQPNDGSPDETINQPNDGSPELNDWQ
uniref:Uncharacterized protein n=1 Tax=Lactuca sativa TaxID=4236 RepID=A0A9R1WDS7_LACSA|nr:hypothetical protein LSAT_V11C200094000 [Lactuca sativa]